MDAAQWRPEDRALEKTARPDRSLALKAAHEAAQAGADYDRRFRAKAQAALDGLQDGTNGVLSPDEVEARRAALRARPQALQTARAA